MSDLIKYHSIENHYLTKTIEFAKRRYGDDFKNCSWEITEKIHGANTSFLIRPNVQIKHFSRNQEIFGNEFYATAELLSFMDSKLHLLQDFADRTQMSVRLYGEIFGDVIQKEVNYGPEKRIIFYNAMINDELVTQIYASELFKAVHTAKYFTRSLAVLNSFDEALEFNQEFNSTYSDLEDNICEGVVIKPYDAILINQDKPFFLKKKNDAFLEKKQKRVKKEKHVRPEVHTWHETFLSYIHKGTVHAVFSKEGPITDMSEIGKYIQFIIADAKDTFNREEEFPVEDFDKNEQRYIFNAGRECMESLKEEL